MILEKRIPISYWFKIIKWDLLIVLIFSTGIHYLSVYLPNADIPISIGAFLGTAIALLLSFKLSQSYDRWWEARKIWGEIVNDSRTLVVQLKNFSSNEEHPLVKEIAERQIAWAFSFGQSLRKLNPLEDLKKRISLSDFQIVKSHSNIPLSLLDLQANSVRKLHKENEINDFQQVQIDGTLVRLCAAMGKAERIKNTAFPKTYRLTLHLFIYIFLITLSLSITHLHSIVEVPLLMFIALPFLLLEKIALSIQDPFENRPSDTAMTTIANTIETNIKDLLGETPIAKSLKEDSFYIL